MKFRLPVEMAMSVVNVEDWK